MVATIITLLPISYLCYLWCIVKIKIIYFVDVESLKLKVKTRAFSGTVWKGCELVFHKYSLWLMVIPRSCLRRLGSLVLKVSCAGIHYSLLCVSFKSTCFIWQVNTTWKSWLISFHGETYVKVIGITRALLFIATLKITTHYLSYVPSIMDIIFP